MTADERDGERDRRQHQAREALVADRREQREPEREQLQEQQADPERRHRDAQRRQREQRTAQSRRPRPGGDRRDRAPEQQRDPQGEAGQRERLRERVGEQLRHGGAGAHRDAQVTGHRPPEQHQVLLERRAVEPVAGAQLGHLRRVDGAARVGRVEHDAHRVARQQVEHRERDRERRPEHQDRGAEPAQDVPRHWSAPIQVSWNSSRDEASNARPCTSAPTPMDCASSNSGIA